MKVFVFFYRIVILSVTLVCSRGGLFNKMQEFEKISIAEISKKDMLVILEALEYTGKNTNIDTFVKLKDNIIKELSELADTSEDEFINYLNKDL